MQRVKEIIGHTGRKSGLQDGIVGVPRRAWVKEGPIGRLLFGGLVEVEREPGECT
jgi:hypothetical protein